MTDIFPFGCGLKVHNDHGGVIRVDIAKPERDFFFLPPTRVFDLTETLWGSATRGENFFKKRFGRMYMFEERDANKSLNDDYYPLLYSRRNIIENHDILVINSLGFKHDYI